MEKLIVLGTGHATVTNVYNTCFALKEGDEYLLVDAGGGNRILTQLENANISLNHMHHLFVSHAHSDHVLGVVWVIRMIGQMMNTNKYQGFFHIYAHTELIDIIQQLCKLTLQSKITDLFNERMIFHELEDGKQLTILWHNFTFFDIQSTKMKQFGFYYLDLDKKYTFCGDEPYNEACHKYVKDSYLLMHEAFCLYKDRNLYDPYKKHHSTVKDACELATSLNVEKLILWHSEHDHLDSHFNDYLSEAKGYYSKTLYIPRDLDVIEL